MTFERVAVLDALEAILAHSIRAGELVIRKGTVLTKNIIEDLSGAGVSDIYVARLAAGDVSEAEAAARLAERIAGSGVTAGAPTNGRVDLHSEATGLVVVDRATIDAVNLAQSAIQLATLREYTAAEAGQIVATVKVVPFGVSAEIMALAEAAVANAAVSLVPFQPLKVGVVATETPFVKASVMEKTMRVLSERLELAGAYVHAEERVAHDPAEVGRALETIHDSGSELLIIFGASATSDASDVVPAGIEAAGGCVTRIGMPVDPGNLLVFGELEGRPVIGAPGCARSPAPSGFDWVLQRLLAGLPLSADEIGAMGVGGVLAEKRSQRAFAGEPATSRRRIDALVLAAGASSRMKGQQKLLAKIDGRPLVRRAVEAAIESGVASVTVVVGHRGDEVTAALTDLDVKFVDNQHYATGLSSSVRAGVQSLDAETDGVVILLGDMPEITSKIVTAVIDGFDPDLGRHIVVPTFDGKAGNPVLWSRRYFPDLISLDGDMGAREMIRANTDSIAWVKTGPAVTIDVDTPEALAAIGGSWR